jgi:hypothetical protein
MDDMSGALGRCGGGGQWGGGGGGGAVSCAPMRSS